MTRLQKSLRSIRRDALAGTVTGIMAVPLSVGICLMSDYPVMTGLYTVIFAGFISFITYLFKPGNYTGMPGIAAGLAPALALGVHTFGYQNMPFVILLTSVFQAIVWKYRLEKYILKIVPHYLVEGLLAGVGLKIGMKFIPFLYDIEHETDVWLNLEREAVILLSLLSFVCFVLLYKYYKNKMPALPYFLIMISSVALTYIMPLPKISIDSVPFELALPFPDFSGYTGNEVGMLLIKMVGFAMMLGTIDIIEQVMSNVAIERMDPFQRKTDSNNSLLAIWIANFGATFFGGMTNLDGLAKSTTNTVAGAVTKLSNVFTSLVILIAVIFPELLNHLPEYALGIIMVYSGWKMVANISNVRSEGRYALILAGICGLLVFKLGIFEGLLLVLFSHAIIQYIFMRRHGHGTSAIWRYFKTTINSEKPSDHLETLDMTSEPQVPVLDKWVKAVNASDIEAVMNTYAENAQMLPALTPKILHNKNEIKDFYQEILDHNKLEIIPRDVFTQKVDGFKVDSGHYEIHWLSDEGQEDTRFFRFSFVIKDGKITTHHSSPDPEVSLLE